MKTVLLITLTFFIHYSITAQYTVNGNASKDNCHCYTLTPNSFNNSGSVWNDIKINLSQSFDFSFDINLGCDDAGADGIVFVLQPISTSVGTSGGGLGFLGVSPSVGVTIDTWQNADAGSNDPFYDHIAIQLNGNIDHQNLTNNIAGPVTALQGNDNIEDCKWHTLRIQWDATTKKLTAYIDGALRVSVVKDFITDVFGGNPLVFWGFTGSTGGARNLQQFCTALSPGYKLLPAQKRCINEPIAFFDSTISFAPVIKNYWDFGDGSPIDSINLNPVHTYVAAGNYTVQQKVIGADGCIEINSQPLLIGSIPIAGIIPADGCASALIQLNDNSSTAVGTINQWNWDLGNGTTSTLQNPTAMYASAGTKNITLSVQSLEGCESATVSTTLEVNPLPVVDFTVNGLFCKKSNLQFTNLSSVVTGSIVNTTFDFGNGLQLQQPNPVMQYDSSKNYNPTLTVITDKGCTLTKLKSIFIMPAPIAAFKYNAAVCKPYAASFTDSSYTTSGNNVTNWWWQLGNGTIAAIQNPITSYTLPGNTVVQLVVKTSNGCLSDTAEQTISFKENPIAKFVYSSPLCEGQPVSFTDSSFLLTGNIASWEWWADGILTSNQQNPLLDFSAGLHKVQLLVADEAGCKSDSATSIIAINKLPIINMQFADGCKDNTIIFKADNLSSEIISSWKWDFGDNNYSLAKDTQHIYTATGNYSVKLMALSAEGCAQNIDSNITIFGTNAFAGNDTIAAANQPIQLLATGGTTYQWDPAVGLSNSTIANPVAILNSSQQYTVRAFSPAGCESFASINIKIYDGPEIYVPKAFTPNGDFTNDILKAFPVGMRQFKNFSIYNRLGQMVFATNNASIGWTGYFKNSLQPAGAYVWIASGNSYKGIEIVRKGTVVLLR